MVMVSPSATLTTLPVRALQREGRSNRVKSSDSIPIKADQGVELMLGRYIARLLEGCQSVGIRRLGTANQHIKIQYIIIFTDAADVCRQKSCQRVSNDSRF